MSDDEKSLGEMSRSLDRIERVVEHLATQMMVALAPVAMNTAQIASLSSEVEHLSDRVAPVASNTARIASLVRDVDEVSGQVRRVADKLSMIEVRTASIAGGITAVGFLLRLLWK